MEQAKRQEETDLLQFRRHLAIQKAESAAEEERRTRLFNITILRPTLIQLLYLDPNINADIAVVQIESEMSRIKYPCIHPHTSHTDLHIN